MKGKEWMLAIVTMVISLGFAIGGYFSTGYWQSLFINLATTTLGLTLALVVINVYLDLNTRKDAIKPLLKLVKPTIQEHHNALLNKAWASFGKPQFAELIDRYSENNGDPRSLAPQERETLYKMIKEDKDALFARISTLEAELKELALLLGWSFKPGILRASFSCRYAIVRLKTVNFDDSDQSKLDACEHFLDLDIAAHSVFHQLVEFLGMKKSDVYGN